MENTIKVNNDGLPSLDEAASQEAVEAAGGGIPSLNEAVDQNAAPTGDAMLDDEMLIEEQINEDIAEMPAEEGIVEEPVNVTEDDVEYIEDGVDPELEEEIIGDNKVTGDPKVLNKKEQVTLAMDMAKYMGYDMQLDEDVLAIMESQLLPAIVNNPEAAILSNDEIANDDKIDLLIKHGVGSEEAVRQLQEVEDVVEYGKRQFLLDGIDLKNYTGELAEFTYQAADDDYDNAELKEEMGEDMVELTPVEEALRTYEEVKGSPLNKKLTAMLDEGNIAGVIEEMDKYSNEFFETHPEAEDFLDALKEEYALTAPEEIATDTVAVEGADPARDNTGMIVSVDSKKGTWDTTKEIYEYRTDTGDADWDSKTEDEKVAAAVDDYKENLKYWEGSFKNSSFFHKPTDGSGWTIAPGIDLAHKNAAYLKKMGVPQRLIDYATEHKAFGKTSLAIPKGAPAMNKDEWDEVVDNLAKEKEAKIRELVKDHPEASAKTLSVLASIIHWAGGFKAKKVDDKVTRFKENLDHNNPANITKKTGTMIHPVLDLVNSEGMLTEKNLAQVLLKLNMTQRNGNRKESVFRDKTTIKYANYLLANSRDLPSRYTATALADLQITKDLMSYLKDDVTNKYATILPKGEVPATANVATTTPDPAGEDPQEAARAAEQALMEEAMMREGGGQPQGGPQAQGRPQGPGPNATREEIERFRQANPQQNVMPRG